MTDIHSCSLYCDRPACIKQQRDKLRDALAQPEQEPVAFMCHGNLYVWPSEDDFCGNPEDHIPLYTTPQPAAQAEPSQVQQLVNQQAEDESLWCDARTIFESMLQEALRRLHAAIESTPNSASVQEPMAWEQFYPDMGKGPLTAPPLPATQGGNHG